MRHLATDDQIEAAEATLRTHFPEGYRDYVTTLGAGYLNGTMRVLPPAEIVGQTAEFQERLQFLYGDEGDDPSELFAAGLDLLPREQLLACILLIDAGGGHEIIYYPDAPGDIFLLPHGHDRIDRIGHTVEEALDWFLSPDRYGDKTLVLTPQGHFVQRPIRWFEPDRDQSQAEFILKESVAFADVREYLVWLALQRPASALCVAEPYVDDEGKGHEVMRLFDYTSGGAVQCSEGFPMRGIYIQISFDADRRDENVEALITYCESHARARINADGVIVSI